MPSRPSSPLLFAGALLFGLSACNATDQQALSETFRNAVTLEDDTPALFENRVTLLEKPGSRALRDGYLALQAQEPQRAKVHFSEASQPDIASEIRAEALREMAKLSRAQDNSYTANDINNLQEAHRLGDYQATVMLADIYMQQQQDSAATSLLMPIYKDYVPAKKRMALLQYRRGESATPLLAESLNDYRALLAEGDTSAHSHLAELYSLEGTAVYHPQLRAYHYEQALRYGDNTAYRHLADIYRTGNGAPKDTARAVRIYEYLATQGSGSAANHLRDAFAPDGWHEHRPERHVAYIAQDARNGSRSAAYQMVNAWLDGYGVEPDVTQAQQWIDYILTSEPEQTYHFAKTLLDHENPQARTLGKQYLETAIASGDKNAANYYKSRYFSNLNSLSAVNQAAQLLRQQPSIADSRTYYSIAEKYFEFEQPDNAVSWLKRAADKGSIPAMKHYARLHAVGLHVTRDAAASLSWYEKAARAGDSEAQYHTGFAYARGSATLQDKEKAMYWLKRASNSGRDDAAALLQSLQQQDQGA